LLEFIQICQKLDNQIRARKAEKQGSFNRINQINTATQSYPMNTNSEHYGPAPMELGATRYIKLTPELHTSLPQENKYLYCRKVSHFIRDCSEKKAADNRNSAIRVAAATVTTNTEEVSEKDQASE
jgi:hypothetical protein